MTGDRLIIFARYPEAGRTKTRLIPALGPEGAAELHRNMAEHTLQIARGLQERRPVDVEVRYEGGDEQRMLQWLGNETAVEPQGTGDLGDRLMRAFHSAFEGGARAVVIIGTDCPGITASVLHGAFESVGPDQLVLGPASDGGYYLIGLTRLVPALFEGIHWSTEAVFRETVEAARVAGVRIVQLPTLDDVDRPEDLPVWERYAQKR